ncbi:peptidase M52 [Dictyobacter alpinus]|uniref:Peptidase M52 n=1 Tax=Dictyobacter alpinus TaxID=2014873 RepID=A0A402BGJ4_9CHLR|nr:hydrogenase maturation protease [Dictyobacter alpinus]GCE30456.1 peptidase M52 [Dictyobacter alpinus]
MDPVTGSVAPRKILIACIGNIFFGDDGFGVEVARQLMIRRYPSHVQVVDFGIRGMDLAYTLLEDFDELVLVDTVSWGRPPGTLYLIEPDLELIAQAGERGVFLDAHSLDPVKILSFARSLGAAPIHTSLVGCEPESLGSEEDEISVGLSPTVQAMIPAAIAMLDKLVAELSFAKKVEVTSKGAT